MGRLWDIVMCASGPTAEMLSVLSAKRKQHTASWTTRDVWLARIGHQMVDFSLLSSRGVLKILFGLLKHSCTCEICGMGLILIEASSSIIFLMSEAPCFWWKELPPRNRNIASTGKSHTTNFSFLVQGFSCYVCTGRSSGSVHQSESE